MELLGVAAVAKLTGVSPGTLRYWRSIGAGPASYKLGGRRVVYERAELDRWLAEQKAATLRGGQSAAV